MGSQLFHTIPLPSSRLVIDRLKTFFFWILTEINSNRFLTIQGAMYFVLYGNMWFDGDGPVPSVQFNKAEMRYTAPGYAYGPEYNSDFDPLEIIVLGVETPPTFEEPRKPYKFQKPVTVTHIFDEL